MRPPLRAVWVAACVTWLLLVALSGPPGPAVLAQEEPPAVLLELVNGTRLDEGLDPYGRSRLLSSAAQGHADDLAENGLADPDDVHRGSDGSDAQGRVEEAGYVAWTRDDGGWAVAESIWSGLGAPEDALAALLENQADRGHLLSEAYREIGIGAAVDAGGRSFYVLDFGARPNVLPIFINDGSASTDNREVAIRLTNERVRPGGEGASFVGEAVEIRISNEPSFDELVWESWAPLVSWVLPEDSGEHTVYVQFRDAADRTTASSDGILLDAGTPATPTEVPSTPTSTPQPTETAVPPSPTLEPTATPEPATAEPAEPTATDPPSTVTPPAATVVGEMASPTPSPSVSRATPFPTWTPLPSPTPAPDGDDEPEGETLSLPKLRGYGRPLAAVGILQGVVIVLGLYWVMRRGRGA